jgi:hypothetical protein
MSIAVPVQTKTFALGSASTGASWPITPDSAFAAGNAACLGIFWKANVNITGVADTSGNTWVDSGLGRATRPVDGYAQVFVCKSLVNSAPTITVSWDGTMNSPGMDLLEYAGADSTTLLDSAQSTGTATSGTSVSTSVTPTIADGAVVAFAYTNDTDATAGSGFTARIAVPATGNIVQDKLFTSSPGTVTATANLLDAITKGVILAIVLRAASAGGATAGEARPNPRRNRPGKIPYSVGRYFRGMTQSYQSGAWPFTESVLPNAVTLTRLAGLYTALTDSPDTPDGNWLTRT